MFEFDKEKPENTEKVSESARWLIDMLGCPCEYFPKDSDIDVIMSAYNEAFAKREMGGYTPLIIVSRRLEDHIGEYATPEELRANRDKLLSSEPINVKKWFADKITELKEDVGDYWSKIVGTLEKNPEDASNGFSEIAQYDSPKKSVECILAKIPTENPWEVFAWLPFGGWDECPMPEEILWIAKYWYETRGAIPAVMTRDTLVFSTAPVKNETSAMDLALEQYVLCGDIVNQGFDTTIGRLAGKLMQSSAWLFWWD